MFTVVCNCEQFLSTLIGTIFETSSNSRTLDETVNNIAIFLVPLGIILIWFFNSLKVLREVGLDDLLSQREKLNHRLQEILYLILREDEITGILTHAGKAAGKK